MAQKESEAGAAPQPVIMVNSEQFGAQELHRQQEEMRAKGVKLNETVPGGKFLDGPNATTYHDANGNPVGGDPKSASAPVQVVQAVESIQSDAEIEAAIARLEARREVLKQEAEAREEQAKAQQKAQAEQDKAVARAREQQEKDQQAAARKSAGKR